MKPDYATRLFETLRKRAGLPKITLHGARHENASLWIAGGGDVTPLSKRLGHSTSRITADLYVSRVGDADRVHADRVAGMIPRATRVHERVHAPLTTGPDENSSTRNHATQDRMNTG